MRYSPKPAADYRAGFLDKMKMGTEAWNLAFLALDFEKYPFAHEDSGVAVWRTTCSSITTGEFLNPHMETSRVCSMVASLLHMPPVEFMAWAENSPVIARLPLTVLLPNWVSTARNRLQFCVEHPTDKLVMALDAQIKDTSQAMAFLSKFMTP